MSDEREELKIAFETEEEEYVREQDVKPVEDPDAKLPEEVKKKTKSELYAEVQKAQQTPSPQGEGGTAAALSKLADTLAAREAPRPAATAAGETEEQFRARLKQDLFDDAKAGDTLRDAVQRYASPLLSQQTKTIYEQAVKLLRIDPETGPVFRKYESEVKAYIGKNFPGYEQSPQALDLAFQQVKASHIDEIAQELANAKVATELERLKKEAAAAGRGGREPLTLEAGGNGGRPQVKKVFVVTKADEDLAEMRGVDPQKVARARARRESGK